MPSSLAVTHSSTFGYSPRPPVSVSGTGRHGLKLSGFSREPPSPRCPLGRSLAVLSRLSTLRVLDCGRYAFALQPAIPSAGGGSGPPSPLRSRDGYGNVDPSSVGKPAFQLASLRPRLTLIRLALIRKPWSSGVRVSHPHCRYSCLHLLFRTLQQPSRATFRAVRPAGASRYCRASAGRACLTASPLPLRFNLQFRLQAAVPVLRPRFAAMPCTGMLTRRPSGSPGTAPGYP